MKFECDSCHAQYMIADEKVGKRGVKVKCKRCSHVIVVRPDTAAKGAATTSPKGVAPTELAGKSPTETDADDQAATVQVSAPARVAPAPVSVPSPDPTEFAADDRTEMAATRPVDPEPAPQLSDRTEVSMAPTPPASPLPAPPTDLALPAPPPAPSVKGESSIGDALDDQLAGAFNSMFDEGRPALGDLSSLAQSSPADEQRGPTQVLDLDSMNALRRATAGPERVERDVLDSLRRDLGPPADEGSGMWGSPPSPPIGSNGKPLDDGIDLPVWHVAIDDEDVGPITLEAMSGHIASGAVDRASLVWKSGMSDWLPAGEVAKVKDLFVNAPLPKIAPPPEVPAPSSRSTRPGPFDTGDAGSRGRSPFDSVAGEQSDPHWQPHGLTAVYQAANLAEAANGGVGGGAGQASRGGSSPPSSSSEPEWRPSASSALSALVNDEIDRISKAPTLPPADELAPRPADEPGLGGSLPFSSLAGMSLDAGGELADPPQMMVQTGSGRTAQVPTFSTPAFPQPVFNTQPFAPPPVAPTPARSPMLYVGVLGVVVVFVMLGLLTYKVVFDQPAQVVVLGPGGVPMQPGQLPGIAPPAPVAAPVPAPAPVAAPVPAPVAAAPTPTPEPAAPTPTPEAAPPTPAPAPAPAPAVVATTVKRPKTPPAPPPAPAPAPVATPKKCDPILDFDCKPTGGATAEPKEPTKVTLEKSDILGVVKGALPKVKACGQKHGATGTIKMTWTIAKNGKPQGVAVADTTHGGTPVGTCVTQVVQGLKFPAYSGAAPPPVSIPLPL